MRKLGTWLAILAIVLQAAWPLLAAAKPRAVALVPLCTVDGVPHYLEVPTGNTPLDDSVHHEHCAFCTLGVGALLPSAADLPFSTDALADRIASLAKRALSRPALLVHGARAPPFSGVVTSNDHNFGRRIETPSTSGRARAGAPHSSRFVRLGVLHGRHAVEHAERNDDLGHAA